MTSSTHTNTAIIVNKFTTSTQHALAAIAAGEANHLAPDDMDVKDFALVPFDPACAPSFNDPRMADRLHVWATPVPMRQAVREHGEQINVDPHSAVGAELFDSEVATETACLIDAAAWFFDCVYVVTPLPDTFGEGLYHLTTITREKVTGNTTTRISYSIGADVLDARIPNDALLVHGLAADLEKFFHHPVAEKYILNPAVAPHLKRAAVELRTHVIDDIVDTWAFSNKTLDDELACTAALNETPVARGFDTAQGTAVDLNGRQVLGRLGFFDEHPPTKLFTKYITAKGPTTVVLTDDVRDMLDVYDVTDIDISYAVQELAHITASGNNHQTTIMVQEHVAFTDEVRFFLAGEDIVCASGRILRDTPDIVALGSAAQITTWCDSVATTQLDLGHIHTVEAFSTGRFNETAHYDPRAASKVALAREIARDIVEHHGPQFATIDIGTMYRPSTGEVEVALVEVNHGINAGYFHADSYSVMRGVQQAWHTQREQCLAPEAQDGWLTWADIAPTTAAHRARVMKLIGTDITPVTVSD